MTDLSKSMPADDNEALRLAIAMLHFPSIFITKKHLISLGFSPPGRISCLSGTSGSLLTQRLRFYLVPIRGYMKGTDKFPIQK